MVKIPAKLQWVFWSVDLKNLDLEKDKMYIIHQVLAYGRMEEIHWLFQTYSLPEICRIFINSSFKNYRPSRFNFVKNYLLPLEDRSMIPERYVINTPRNLG
ncbi:hypothetical protein HY085_00715 [Candidatus Gottesmanbacteria bacterium]|nr:hypothetical protein [Candidatus Gottesmanbacteria bacterium]